MAGSIAYRPGLGANDGHGANSNAGFFKNLPPHSLLCRYEPNNVWKRHSTYDSYMLFQFHRIATTIMSCVDFM